MDQQVGSGSLCFAKAPFIIGTASVVGTKEGEGPLADAFDCIGPDDKFGQQTWEAAERSIDACPRESRSKAGRYEVPVCRRSAWTADCLIIWIKNV